MKRFCIVCGIILAFTLFVLGALRSQRLGHEQEAAARQKCVAMGGQPLLDYSYNSNIFYITGCKLDPVRR